jgi:hypothetical protein
MMFAALEHYRANTFRWARRSITKVRSFQVVARRDERGSMILTSN